MSASRQFFRIFAAFLVAAVLLFLVNRYLVLWLDWPDLGSVFDYFAADSGMTTPQLLQGLGLWLLYIVTALLIVRWVRRTPDTGLNDDAQLYQRMTLFVVRAAFWSVFLVGLVDATLSFLRVEELLEPALGEHWAGLLDQPRSRGLYVHYPLIALSLVIAWFTRSLGFIWLAMLVVLAEFSIVLSRFIFSYEQAFMGDLVRFWYASLFLFGSAYTLAEGGHVRVDVIYAGMRKRTQAWVNAIGSLLLGLPLCWTILLMGMGNKQGSLVAPLINFEISQSGYGMYVKYLMASFLLVFAVSMAIQFVSYFLHSVAIIRGEIAPDDEHDMEDVVVQVKEAV
ncbi:MAG: TRAP transporter small permease subunit [Thiolinea sp.]